MQQSFAWWCFRNRGIPDSQLLAAAAKIGYAGVDLIEESLWAEARDRGLRIAAVGGHGTIQGGLNRPENRDRITSELLDNIDKAHRWSIPVLICFSGNLPTGGHSGAPACAELLTKIAPVAEQAGVTLAIEMLNSKVDHPDYEADHTSWGVDLSERVNSPAVKLLYDIYHMQIMEGDLIRTIGQHHAHFAHYHTAGNPGRGPLGGDQEIAYPAVYRAIAATGFDGFIAHEFVPVGAPAEELALAFEQCATATQAR